MDAYYLVDVLVRPLFGQALIFSRPGHLLYRPLKIFFCFPMTCFRDTPVTFVPRSLLQKLQLVLNYKRLLSTHVV